MGKKPNRDAKLWYTIDLHIHTPASSDFQQPYVSYLDILRRAEQRGLDAVAFTDHNTISGYRQMKEEIEQLELLKKLNRLLPNEKEKLNEYQRLLSKVVVFPGFEFTATFGFHILCVFPPEKPVREIEHLLLTLNIPADHLDDGSQTVGATSDVLTVYRIVNQAGGLVIAAHANSSNGVAMRGFNFGGQTKIAYTQDNNLHALEVTDLEIKGPRSTAAFFSGTKPEYPRRMHCIQGSDSHRLSSDPQRKKILGVGDRATDVMLPELSFDALKSLFLNNDFSKTRPHRFKEEPAYDFIQAAQEEGSNIIQDFHDSMTVRGGKLYAILADICAFANTNGGTLYIGLSNDIKIPTAGIQDIEHNISLLEKEINSRISPPLQCSLDIHEYKGKKIIRILVPRGSDSPYAVDDNKIYVRDEAETGLAVRDEIVNLVLRNKPETPSVEVQIPSLNQNIESEKTTSNIPLAEEENIDPRTGVEVFPPEERQGKIYFSVRDLRNGNIVKNVTLGSARKLWSYALSRYNEMTMAPDKQEIIWHGNFGLTRKFKQGNIVRYDFIRRTPNGFRYFFGVTLDGIHSDWKSFVSDDDNG